MTRLLATICILLAIAMSSTSAQFPVFEARKSIASSVEYYATNFGTFGLNAAANTSGFVYPRGSGQHYIFGAGLWFGCKKMVQGALQPAVFVTYNPNSGASWAYPGESDGSSPTTQLFNSVEYDHQSGAYNGVRTPAAVEHWPLWLLPGMKPGPLSEGIYEPVDADRSANGNKYYSGPAFMPGVDEQFVARFHDGNLSRYEMGPKEEASIFPIGLQMQQNIYSWSTGPFQSTVVLQYAIRNISGTTLYDCVASGIEDIDIGNPANDQCRFYSEHPELRTGYCWSDPKDSVGRGTGAVAVTLIEAPMTDAKGFVDNSRRAEFMLKGRVSTYRSYDISEDPVNSVERYAFMTSGKLDGDKGPMDVRNCISGQSFSMHPGDVAYFTVAYTVVGHVPEMGKAGRGGITVPASSGATELEGILTPLMHAYFGTNGFENVAAVPVTGSARANGTLTALPNPATSNLTLRFAIDEPSEVSIDLVNTLGATVLTKSLGMMSATEHEERLDCSGLPAGLYLATIRHAGGRVTTQCVIAH
ncbi:MAG TPA: T9SS type A sorting domain-containing protein [Candidatus Kapabacteria bacterium]|nr:T9SS type A sorting domain-containing protein [Candidatus Kapabacteria bacterium]